MKKSTIVLLVSLVVVALVIIPAIVLACLNHKAFKPETLQFDKITLTNGQGLASETVSMENALPGDKLTNTISFSKSEESEPMYIRAKVKFTTTSDIQAIQDLVTQLNKGTFNIKDYTTVENSTYKWSECMSNYYYLMDITGDTVHALSTNDTIILAESLVLSKDLKQDSTYSQYMKEITLNIEIQAVQTTGIANDFDTVDTKFCGVFGARSDFVRQGMTFGKYDTTSQFKDYYYVDYGYYPQSLASYIDVNLLTEENKVDGETYTIKDSTSCDVYSYNGGKYIKYNTSSKDTTQVVYKIEQVRWIILGSVKDDQTTTAIASEDFTTAEDGTLTYNGNIKNLLVLSEKVLVQSLFNSSVDDANCWGTSKLCTFMNGTFMNNIFTSEEQNKIQTTTLSTSWCEGDDTTVHQGSSDAQTISQDKLFILGYYDTDTFSVKNYFAGNAAGSEFAFATNIYNGGGIAIWWLRAGDIDGEWCSHGDYYYYGTWSGGIQCDNVTGDNIGVRPAFVLNVA